MRTKRGLSSLLFLFSTGIESESVYPLGYILLLKWVVIKVFLLLYYKGVGIAIFILHLSVFYFLTVV